MQKRTITVPDKGITVEVNGPLELAYDVFYTVCEKNPGFWVWINDGDQARAGRTPGGNFV